MEQQRNKGPISWAVPVYVLDKRGRIGRTDDPGLFCYTYRASAPHICFRLLISDSAKSLYHIPSVHELGLTGVEHMYLVLETL